MYMTFRAVSTSHHITFPDGCDRGTMSPLLRSGGIGNERQSVTPHDRVTAHRSHSTAVPSLLILILVPIEKGSLTGPFRRLRVGVLDPEEVADRVHASTSDSALHSTRKPSCRGLDAPPSARPPSADVRGAGASMSPVAVMFLDSSSPSVPSTAPSSATAAAGGGLSSATARGLSPLAAFPLLFFLFLLAVLFFSWSAEGAELEGDGSTARMGDTDCALSLPVGLSANRASAWTSSGLLSRLMDSKDMSDTLR
jgi:hypothetical protein